MTSTITRDSDNLAVRRVGQIVHRCQQGQLTPAVALRQVEAYAAALHVALYDLAVDTIEQVAVDRALNLEPVPHREAKWRKHFGEEAATRRARRYERKLHKPATKRGAGVEANLAERVTMAQEWRVVGPTSEPVALRPIWAVNSAGVADDAAYVLGSHKAEGLGLLGAATFKGKSVVPSRHHGASRTVRVQATVPDTGKPARLREAKPGTTVWVARTEEAIGSGRQGITPNLAYRVPSVAVDPKAPQCERARQLAPSPLLEAKEQWLAIRRTGSTARAKQRQRAYQRNGWAH